MIKYFSDIVLQWYGGMKTLDVEAVQAFVLAVDLKSFTRAAEAMETTQSAVSLKIKRLEDGLGKRLLERTPRLVRLSADGSAFLGPARALVAAHKGALGSFGVTQRRLVIGISHHVVGAELPGLLKRMIGASPGLVMEMRVSSSQDVFDELDSGSLDAAVVLRRDGWRRDGEIILEEEFGWFAAPDFEYPSGGSLPLATQAEPCSVRSMALSALQAAGVSWTEVFIGGGVATIGAAISAGLAVAALGRRVAPPGTIDIGEKLGLPPLPSREVMLYANVADQQARGFLRSLATAIRSTTGARASK
jgi:DNA-binding transcriptional LysR family regulator